jgi:hypothetical protein
MTPIDPTQASSTTSQAPDFKQIRRYLRTAQEREAHEKFIQAGWTAPELAEYARVFRLPGKTRPTASSYQIVVGMGADNFLARSALEKMRSPGYVLPPLNRPGHDDPENPEHSAETRAEVEVLARRLMARADDKCQQPWRGPDAPISKSLWRESFHKLRRYGDLKTATIQLGLWKYA